MNNNRLVQIPAINSAARDRGLGRLFNCSLRPKSCAAELAHNNHGSQPAEGFRSKIFQALE